MNETEAMTRALELFEANARDVAQLQVDFVRDELPQWQKALDSSARSMGYKATATPDYRLAVLTLTRRSLEAIYTGEVRDAIPSVYPPEYRYLEALLTRYFAKTFAAQIAAQVE